MDKNSVDSYFSSLNSICRGVIKQKVNFTSLLGDQWDNLPASDQDALLDEHFISPHIKQKYSIHENEDLPSFFPKYKIKSGQRMIEDDEGEIWQDEHSGPFSWETSSQNEFSIEDVGSTDTGKTKAWDPKRPKSPRLTRSSSSDHLALRPSELERSGSTDFNQLRDIWEAHHCTTPDGDITPSLHSFLSRSQDSLSVTEPGDSSSRRRSGSDNIDRGEGKVDNTTQISSKTYDVSNTTGDVSNTTGDVNDKTDDANHTADDANRTADDASHTTTTMTNSIITATDANKPKSPTNQKVTHFGTKVNGRSLIQQPDSPSQSIEARTSMPSDDSVASVSHSSKSEPVDSKKDEGDILAKFGVTFGYSAPSATESAMEPPSDQQQQGPESTPAETTTAALPAGFDFLNAW